MSEHRLQVRIEGAVAVAVLDRADKLNAIDPAMVAALEDFVDRVDRDSDIRAAVLTGAGERAFSSGGDIAAWAALDPLEFGRRWIRDGHRAFDRLARLRQPLVVVLNGPAFGGGLELAACGDLLVAEAHARVGLPETGLGMVPGWSGTQRLVRRFGARSVKRMALFGEMFEAEGAQAAGIVDEVVPRGEGLARGLALAAAAAGRGPVAVEVVKALVHVAEGEERDAGIEALAGALVAGTGDLKEGVESFRGKRRPVFAGR